MRKLASVKEITNIKPIPNADKIEVVEVDHGWKCVVKKDEFQIGDLAVYFEIDSFLPIIPQFEFLRKSCYKKMGQKEGLRLKTIKLRGQISQGLALPLKALKGLIPEGVKKGDDLSKILGVEKYEAPIPAQLAGEAEGRFPDLIQKTDQERIQNLWDEYKDIIPSYISFSATTKLDGSSMTVFVADKLYKLKGLNVTDEEGNIYAKIGVCSRNLQLKKTEGNTFWQVTKQKALIDELSRFYEDTNRSIALQGELMGPGIQKNRENLSRHDFFLFAIWDIDRQRYLLPNEREDILKEYFKNISQVPVVKTGIRVFKEFKSVEDVLKFAEGKSLKADIREGVVFESEGLVDGKVLTFKAISNQFLLGE